MERLQEKVRVGETRLYISRVGLGGAPLGGLYTAVSEEQALATVGRALQLGLRHIDTAPFYGFGSSEERIGIALRGRRRDEYTLSTKVGRVLTPTNGKEKAVHYWAEASDTTAVFDFSEAGVRKSLKGSRARLGVDRFDILFIHDCDGREDEALKHSYPVLNEMRERGEVSAIGAGLNSYETALKLAKREEFDCFLIAGRYTLLEQGAQEDFIPFCRDNRIGVIAGGVFNSGILASGPSQGSKYDYARAPPAVFGKARKIKAVCDRFGVDLRAAALQFVLANTGITSIIIGCRSPQEVEEDSSALAKEIPRGLWDELKAAGLVKEDAPTP
ncbi:MAG: aldo/keto reductase [Nitrososphaerota archaeon]|jgi:D-threo-aldose 1-dehydrogenase|nr:aldo/keto reductase [Nitrososphaerota archaeon]MDG6943084.1 aldo/keto reductase [Nitrososphaerota archaeon]